MRNNRLYILWPAVRPVYGTNISTTRIRTANSNHRTRYILSKIIEGITVWFSSWFCLRTKLKVCFVTYSDRENQTIRNIIKVLKKITHVVWYRKVVTQLIGELAIGVSPEWGRSTPSSKHTPSAFRACGQIVFSFGTTKSATAIFRSRYMLIKKPSIFTYLKYLILVSFTEIFLRSNFGPLCEVKYFKRGQFLYKNS